MKTALFDFDGTLFMTGQANYEAYSKALSLVGSKITKEYYDKNCDGRNYRDFLPKILPKNKLNQIPFIHQQKKKFYQNLIDKIQPNYMLFDIIENIKKNNWQTAIVTTASKRSVVQILQHFDYKTLFDLIIAGEDVTKHKPNPEAYILAMQKLHSSPEDTLIFEDSASGIKAAEATGASIVIIHHH